MDNINSHINVKLFSKTTGRSRKRSASIIYYPSLVNDASRKLHEKHIEITYTLSMKKIHNSRIGRKKIRL